MRHEDDATVGAYLAGELTDGRGDAFEAHLLTCDSCWAEVDAGRRGRALVEQAREPAPQRLREQVLTAATSRRPARGRTRARVLVAAGLAVILTLIAATVIRALAPDPPPVQIAAAVAGYLDQRLPGAGIPVAAGPDLSTLSMVETGAGTGWLAGQPVTAHAYRDNVGRRLLIYLSDRPFPMPDPAGGADPAAATAATHRGVVVLCSRAPHTALVLGDDEALVWRAATVLDLA
jgi:anti-sigma factor RsiW